MPDVKGFSAYDAAVALTNADLRLAEKTRGETNKDVEEGRVVRVDHRNGSGNEIELGSEVILVVSSRTASTGVKTSST